MRARKPGEEVKLPELERAVASIEEVTVPNQGIAAFGLGWGENSGEFLRKLTLQVQRLSNAARGLPIATEAAVTVTGQSRFTTVVAFDASTAAVIAHWRAVDEQLEIRCQLLRGCAAALRVGGQVAAVVAAGTNPVGAFWAASKVTKTIEELLDAVSNLSSPSRE